MIDQLNNYTLFGMRIIVSPVVKPVPKLKLDPDFKWCSERFREEFNQELLERFGTKEVLYVMDPNTLVVSRDQYDELLRQGVRNYLETEVYR